MTGNELNELLQDYTPNEMDVLHQRAADMAYELAVIHDKRIRDYAEGEQKKACYMMAMFVVV